MENIKNHEAMEDAVINKCLELGGCSKEETMAIRDRASGYKPYSWMRERVRNRMTEKKFTLDSDSKVSLANKPCPTPEEIHKNLCDEIHSIWIQKNHDYGDSFHQTYLEEGFAMARIRLSDKLNRFKTLSKTKDLNGMVQDESLLDTLKDLANYALMTAAEIEREKYGKDSE